ncbi:MAG: hypothetical protein US63_C0003G0011 [Candidatus Moranbacteria bacterium GW2011_GWC2_37_8]|nr:MAG: hypothetical protein US63_C0003G0011 [Candidatus Moranbacteria bacterium GW2011_GWC2_37_8]KKQ63216.1 MAG: hypothetical protein US82_C0002G0011 [Parcubacteria group bacterium GW2011_GWC1_38_22]
MSWITLAVAIGAISLINAFSNINKKLDEIIKRQNEAEENILEEVRDYGIDKNPEYDPSGGAN